MTAAEQVRRLRDRLKRIGGYPPTCRDISRDSLVEGAQFFPGGTGLWSDAQDEKFPYGGILFLGSDLGDTQWYDNGKKEPFERTRTGRGLKKLLEVAKIDWQSCFLTNAWPCLRVGKGAVKGGVPGSRDPAFTLECFKFFEFTLDEMKPKLVVPLGLKPACFVTPIDLSAFATWIKPTWAKIDTQPIVCVERNGKKIAFVAVTHPSMQNRKHRKIAKTLEGEAKLLQAGLLKLER